MIVDFTYYSTVYMGQEADQTSFPALCAHASRIIAAMTRWQVDETNISEFPGIVQTMYRLAICCQIDFFALNGLDSVAGNDGRGFTVGKVSISGRSGSDIVKKGAMANNISPMAIMYLEQSGLMNPQVNTAPDMPMVGWWL